MKRKRDGQELSAVSSQPSEDCIDQITLNVSREWGYKRGIEDEVWITELENSERGALNVDLGSGIT